MMKWSAHVAFLPFQIAFLILRHSMSSELCLVYFLAIPSDKDLANGIQRTNYVISVSPHSSSSSLKVAVDKRAPSCSLCVHMESHAGQHLSALAASSP